MKKLRFWLDKLVQWTANNCLPRRLIYFAFIRGAAIATTGQYKNTDPHTLNVMEAMKRLGG